MIFMFRAFAASCIDSRSTKSGAADHGDRRGHAGRFARWEEEGFSEALVGNCSMTLVAGKRWFAELREDRDRLRSS